MTQVHESREQGQEQYAEADPAAVSAPFAPVSPERIKKSRRAKVILIIINALLFCACVGLAYFGYMMVSENLSSLSRPLDMSGIRSESIFYGCEISDKPAFVSTVIPNLTSLFGFDTEQALAYLGESYAITKIDTVSDVDNPDVKQLVVLAYQPDNLAAVSIQLIALPHVYLSLDSDEKVIQIYYQSSLEALGYPSSSFATLTATQNTVYDALEIAGVTPAADYVYPQLTADDYTIFIDPEAAEKRIKKEEYTFEGQVSINETLRTWQLRLSYDYGSLGILQGSGIKPSQRLISISLS